MQSSGEIKMYRIRIHGRGGQGGRMAAKILGLAAFLEGKQSQAFALYGAERRGAPVAAFCRINDKEILERGYIHDPDCIIILDNTILSQAGELGIFKGLKKNGLILVNSAGADKLKVPGAHVVSIDALKIAMELIGKPICNAVMLGAFVKATKLVGLKSIEEASREIIGKRKKHMVDANIKAIRMCHDTMMV